MKLNRSFLLLMSILPILFLLMGLSLTPTQAQSAQKLNVVIKPLSPFVIKVGEGAAATYSGFSIDLWKAIAQRNGWQYEFVWRETVKDLLDSVKQKQADVGIAGISMTKEREEQLDFSYPMFKAGLQIMVPIQSSGFSLVEFFANLFSAGLLRIIGLMLLIIVVAGHVVWLIERKRDETFPKGYVRGVWEGIWWSGVNLATGGFGNKSPKSLMGRLAALGWIFMGIILIANFTAAVTSNLTLREIRGSINSVGDLPGKRVVTVAGATAARYLDEQGIAHSDVKTVEEAYGLLDQQKADAIVYDAPVLLYYANAAGKGKFKVVGPIFKQEFYGIALPDGSPLREPLDRTLLEIIGDGTYQEIYARWFGSAVAR